MHIWNVELCTHSCFTLYIASLETHPQRLHLKLMKSRLRDGKNLHRNAAWAHELRLQAEDNLIDGALTTQAGSKEISLELWRILKVFLINGVWKSQEH